MQTQHSLTVLQHRNATTSIQSTQILFICSSTIKMTHIQTQLALLLIYHILVARTLASNFSALHSHKWAG